MQRDCSETPAAGLDQCHMRRSRSGIAGRCGAVVSGAQLTYQARGRNVPLGLLATSISEVCNG